MNRLICDIFNAILWLGNFSNEYRDTVFMKPMLLHDTDFLLA